MILEKSNPKVYVEFKSTTIRIPLFPTFHTNTMTSAYPNQPIAPATDKPYDYTNLEIINTSIEALSYAHHEFDVSRVALLILNYYFRMENGWAIVPDFRVPEGKRPDYLVEKFQHDPSKDPVQLFVPKIAIELKSASGKSLSKALALAALSMPRLVDDLQEEFSIFLIIMKGKSVAFFEYHNDRALLTEQGYQHYHRAIPFNHPDLARPGRPQYQTTHGYSQTGIRSRISVAWLFHWDSCQQMAKHGFQHHNPLKDVDVFQDVMPPDHQMDTGLPRSITLASMGSLKGAPLSNAKGDREGNGGLHVHE